jgi:hypothetical protein
MRDDSIWNYVSDDEDDEYPEEEPFHYEDKYLYDYQWYHEKFPEAWALNHQEGTGPGQCNNCADYGSVNGVFIGYCANCALYCYEGSRGRGFMGDGVELSDNDALQYPSVFDTYLENVNVNNILPIPGYVAENNNPDRVPSIDYDEDDYLNADPYPDNENNDGDPSSIMNPQFEGGYNDW